MNIPFLYRDTTLPNTVIERYRPGMTIIERGFIDVTQLRGGISGTVRYIVATDASVDVSLINPSVKKWGLRILQRGTILSVLDVYTLSGITQILLSTLPESQNGELIEAARNDLAELVDAAPVSELLTDEWKNRVAFPVGLDDMGEPFPVL